MKNKERMCFGIIIGTRAYFNSELAKDVRKQLLRTLADEGYDYVILPEDATPVSYTHLDVYKRQPLRRVALQPSCGDFGTRGSDS